MTPPSPCEDPASLSYPTPTTPGSPLHMLLRPAFDGNFRLKSILAVTMSTLDKGAGHLARKVGILRDINGLGVLLFAAVGRGRLPVCQHMIDRLRLDANGQPCEIFTFGLDVGCGDVVLYLLNHSTCLEGLNYNLQNLLPSTAAKDCYFATDNVMGDTLKICLELDAFLFQLDGWAQGLGRLAKNGEGCGIRYPVGSRNLKRSFLAAQTSMGVDHCKFPKYWTYKRLIPANPPIQRDGSCAIFSLCIAIETRYHVDQKKKQGQDKIEVDMAWVKRISKKGGIYTAYEGTHPSRVLDLIMKMGGVITRKSKMQGAEVDRCTLIPIQDYGYINMEDTSPSGIIYEMYVYGPVVAAIDITNEYTKGPEKVYRGCPMPLDGDCHFVLCYGYQWIHKKLHLEVLDNIPTRAGPLRVVPFDAFDSFVFPYV